MKKNLQIHVRVTPTTRKQWDELCNSSSHNTQSSLFRSIVTELYGEQNKNSKPDEREH